MKKVIAIALTAVMLVVLAVSASAIQEHAEGKTTNFWRDDKTNVPHSFDTLFVDGVSQMDLKWAVDGSAAKVVNDHPLVVGENVQKTIAFRGWVGISQDKYAGVTVSEVGYYTNDSEASYKKSGNLIDAEDAVKAAGGEFRFESLEINVEGLTAPTLFTIVVKGSDGKLYPFGEFSVNGDFTGAETPAETDAEAEKPATVTAALSVDAAKLYELFTTSNGVNTLEAELKDGYVAFIPGGDDPFFGFAEPLNPGVDAKYAVVKYRLTSEGERTIDFYVKIAEPHARAAVETDGQWHYVIVDLSSTFPEDMATLWDGTVARLDPLSGNGISGTEIDIASIDFFTSEADANAFANGSAQPSQPSEPTNPSTADASVIAIAAVAVVALAGVVVAKKVGK
ncbi:MAG: hypothetical protein IJT49_10345 [Clostridia bacterium]|nr:hypothetical protein [Clostridia bacterium]